MPRVFEIDGGKAKHDYATGGYQAWLDKVCAIRLDKLTPNRINDWKVRELEAASKNPLQLKRAGVTIRSILLSSKARDPRRNDRTRQHEIGGVRGRR